jgi:hypothetical protein
MGSVAMTGTIFTLVACSLATLWKPNMAVIVQDVTHATSISMENVCKLPAKLVAKNCPVMIGKPQVWAVIV